MRSVLLAACAVCLLASAARTAAQTTRPSTQSAAFELAGRIQAPAIRESSGVAASRRFAGVYWTHNDGGPLNSIYAITRQGRLLAEFPVRARNVDWEDIAIDDTGRLYLADIGNNSAQRRTALVHQLDEPDPAGPVRPLRPRRTWELRYPAEPFDAESLFIIADHGYLLSKNRDFSPARLYRFTLDPTTGDKQILQLLTTLPLRMPVIAADASADARLLAVMTVTGPVVFHIDPDAPDLALCLAWQTTFLDPLAEGLCFTTDGDLLATTEGRRIVVFPLRLNDHGSGHSR
ncbi:hypothetical protein [Fontivita pretiosa]|uniref:hypothetical protein n=1 Tax=Fontivita pretiosa TaxID=2989684 RepID=UPI003D1664A4